MNKIELLAPAKNLEVAIAAINSGADAIYIGADNFGARVNASNSLQELEKLVNYAHKFYVKIHVTINTILNNSELNKAVELVKTLYNIGVDAIIVQDMGLIQMAIEGKLPPIQIHASTQCDNRTLEKVKFFDSIGVSRVILARELSLKQIESICKNTNCEIETFIHGALCVSYSGQCYLSYANGGRSANRGECAQPCRKRYSLVDDGGKVYVKDKYLLSLRDFNASESIEKLMTIGVNSFKIEGRLKDINYVKNVVLFYNNLLHKNMAERTSSGRIFTDFVPDINKTFNRGYTDYFLQNRSKCYNFQSPKAMGEFVGMVKSVGKDFFETDCILHPQDGICYIKSEKTEGFLVNKVVGNRVFPNNMSGITKGLKLYRNYDSEFESKLNHANIIRKIGVKFLFFDDKIIAVDEDNNRASVDFVNPQISKNPVAIRNSYVKCFNKLGNTDFYLIDIDDNSYCMPFYPISIINDMRRNLLQKLMNERLANYKKIVQKPICYAKFPVSKLDYRANVLNDKARQFYVGCGVQLIENALEASKNIPNGIELMRTKHCLRYAFGLCSKNCKYEKKLFLLDEHSKKYPLVFDCKNCEMVVLNP